MYYLPDFAQQARIMIERLQIPIELMRKQTLPKPCWNRLEPVYKILKQGLDTQKLKSFRYSSLVLLYYHVNMVIRILLQKKTVKCCQCHNFTVYPAWAHENSGGAAKTSANVGI